MIASAHAGTVAVTNTNDNLAGSLRQAIQSDSIAGDTIVFQIPTTDPGYNAATGTFTISLTSTAAPGTAIVIDHSLTIDGGNQNIVVQRAAAANFNIFRITAGPVTISHLTILNGSEDTNSGSYGGGISNIGGDLILKNCTLRNNAASAGAGAVHNATGVFVADTCNFTGNSTNRYGVAVRSGGALYLAGDARISQSTFSLNSAPQSAAAIYHVSGVLAVDQCTFAQNNGVYSGAIHNEGGALTINNSTLSANNGALAGGIANSSSIAAHARNNIIAGNTVGDSAHADVRGAFVSDGYNFIGVVGSSTGFGVSGSHDQVGTSASPANPQLGALQDNGGPTSTMRPLAGSPVIDQGNGGGVTVDQRGQPRVADQPGVSNAIGGDGSDIGAVEVGLPQTGPTFTVTTTSEHDDGACTNDDCTLLEALNASNAATGNTTINFAPRVTGTITTALTPGGLHISNSVDINGPGARSLAISAVNAGSVFDIAASNVAISGLSIVDANVGLDGGGIYHSSGVLVLTSCAILNNAATPALNGGGGIFNASAATLSLVRCTLYGNFTDKFGGGVYNDGFFTATNCTFEANSALVGGAIVSRSNSGAATMTLRNCTITNCSATSTGSTSGDGGGGVWAEGAAVQNHTGNTIFAGNTSSSGVNPDLRGQYTSDGHNFIGNLSFATGFGLSTHDKFGNPLLGAFGNNGGPTDTVSLQSGSTARDNGDDNLAPSTDQRGYLRSGVSDIGAFEFNGVLPVLKITSIVRLANGHISLQGFGVANSLHTIQAASDPNPGSFSFLGTTMSDGSGFVLYDDAGAVGLTRRFYRLTLP